MQFPHFLKSITIVLLSNCLFIAPVSSQTAPRTSATPQQQKQLVELSTGNRLMREIVPNQVDTFTIALEQHEFFEVFVEQLSAKLELILLAPNGIELAVIDHHLFRQGIERLYWIAAQTGTYQIQVRSLEKADRGSYEIRLETKRKATASDELRAKAFSVYREGWRLAIESDEASRNKAIESYQQALKLFQNAGERWGEAASHHRIGRIYWDLEQWPKALEHLTKSIPTYHDISDLQGEAAALCDQGTIFNDRNNPNYDPAKAIPLLETALPIARASGDKELEGRILYNEALAYDDPIRDPRKAIELYKLSIPPITAGGADRRLAYSFNNMSMAYFDLAEPYETLKALEEALKAIRAVGDRGNEAGYLTNVAMTLYFIGEQQQALETLQQAFAIIESDKLTHIEPYALSLQAQMLNALGEPERALEAYQRNLKNARQLKNADLERRMLESIGGTYSNLAQHQKAIEVLTEALKVKVPGDSRDLNPNILVQLAEAYISLGDIPKAIATVEQALARFGENERPWEKASAYGALGRAHLSANQPQKAVAAILEQWKVSGSKENPYRSLDLAKAYRALGDLVNARAISEAIIAHAESNRSRLLNPDFRASSFAINQDAHYFQVDLLMDLHRQSPNQALDALALEFSEARRARSLLDGLTAARIDIRRGVESHLLEQEKTLLQRLNAKEQFRVNLLSTPERRGEVAGVDKEIQTLLEQYHQTQDQIRKASPENAALSRPPKLTLKDIQLLLDSETLLLEYSLGPERSFAWAITNDSLNTYELPKRTELEDASRTLYGLFTARQPRRGETQSQFLTRVARADVEYKLSVNRLSQLLLGPVATQLTKKRILIVTDGSLGYLPFGALVNPSSKQSHKPPLVVDHEIAYLPSIATLAVLRQKGGQTARANKTLAVIADPVFDSGDDRVQKKAANTPPKTSVANENAERAFRDAGLIDEGVPLARLPFSRQEAEAITSFTTEGESFKALGFRASLETATGNSLTDYRIVHFATHAWINSSNPYLSGLVLSLVDEQGNPRDGFLSLNQIYNLNLNADLVVLSACQTATGKEIKGEGAVGLARAFMYAGAPRVIASLWKVDDAATSEIIKRFYHGMLVKKLPPVVALQSAQIEMSKTKLWSSPFYWAGFVLQGEPN